MTLVEIAVAVAILAVMVLLLAGIFDASTRAWLSAESKIDGNRGARLLADFIAPELRSAMLPAETLASPGSPNLQFLINPESLNMPGDFQNPSSIFWQAPIATETSLGDIAEVGYFVKWEPSGKGAVPSLRRFFVNPTAYDERTGSFASNPDFLIYKSYDQWLSGALLSRVAPADKASGYVGLFAENVIGLWIRFYGADGREIAKSSGSKELATRFDSRVGYQLQVPNPTDPAATPRLETRYLPLRVTLSIAIVDQKHAPALAPVWMKVRSLANSPEARDSTAFLEHFTSATEHDHTLRAILPGLRNYETSVVLENAR